jgi:hypothetical protein
MDTRLFEMQESKKLKLNAEFTETRRRMSVRERLGEES